MSAITDADVMRVGQVTLNMNAVSWTRSLRRSHDDVHRDSRFRANA